MSRKNLKAQKRTKCVYTKCTKDAFRKSLGIYYKGRYFCSRGHARKAFKEKAIKDNE